MYEKDDALTVYLREYGKAHRCVAADSMPEPPRPLGKKYLKELFRTLRMKSYPVYALIAHLPLPYFSIDCTYHYKRTLAGNVNEERDESYRLLDFFTHAAALHRYDEFCIRFDTNTLRCEAETNPETIERIYDGFLLKLCERAMRRNAPIVLDRAMIEKYKLNKIDAAHVGKHLEQINTYLVDKLQREYDALKKLDCIRR